MISEQLLTKLNSNFRIFPIEGAGDKGPKIIRDSNGDPIIGKDNVEKRFRWSKVLEEPLTLTQLKQYIFNGYGVCGGVDGLEIIDVDNKDGKASEYLNFINDNFDLKKFFIVATQSGGYHIYFRSDTPEGNMKLASKIFEGKKITCVETRGVRGYVVFYDKIIKGSIDNVPKLTNEEREDLLSVCKALNEIEEQRKKNNLEVYTGDGESPLQRYIDDPSSVQETKDILTHFGWKEQNGGYWIRPGKEKGISATFGRVGVNKFYVFSTNGGILEEGSHSMVGIRTALLHNNDYGACAKELAEKYGISYSLSKSPKKNNTASLRVVTKHDVLKDILKDWDVEIRYNDIHKRFEFLRRNKWDTDVDFLCGRICNEMEENRTITDAKGNDKAISINQNKVWEMIKSGSISVVYDPFAEFIKSLPAHDNTDKFSKLFDYIDLQPGEDLNYCLSMLRKFFIRSIRCVLEQDYTNRSVLVLYGPQEIGKSKFWQWIVPTELYYDDPISPDDKDSILALSRYMIVNLDDIDTLKKNEVSKLKAFISKGEITKRLSYGRNDQKFIRRANIVASTNESDILIDTSNTRWVILKVFKFNWRGYLANIKPHELWAQAYAEFKKDNDSGELTMEEKILREQRNNEEFLEISAESELLTQMFEEGKNKYTLTEIFDHIQSNYLNIRLNMKQLKRELHRHFGTPKSTSKDGRKGRFYTLKKKNEVETLDDYYDNDKSEDTQTKLELPVSDDLPF